MYTNNAYNTYKSNSVNYVSKEQLLVMLVEGAVKFAKIGRQAIVDKDPKKAHENLIKTQNIFFELMTTLDLERAGEWGKDIFAVYDFIVHRLIDANMKKDLNMMNEIIPLIEGIRDMWQEAYELSKKQTASK